MTLIEEMEMYAHEHDVPIMQKEGIDFMCSFLKEHNLCLLYTSDAADE